MVKKEKNIYIIASVIFLLASYFSLGYHHFDEHFQILEFAGLKLNLTSAENLPWEFHNQMRPSFQPAIVALLHNLLGVFGISNPFTITFLLRLLSAILTFTGMVLLYNVYKDKIGKKHLRSWFLLISLFLWYIVFNGVRFSSENWSGVLFIIAFALYFLIKKQNKIFYLTIGFILGFSFLSRYQAGFLIAGFLSWIIFIKKEKIINYTFIFIGVIAIMWAGIFLDRWLYGEWTITTLNYLDQNIFQNKVSTFGVSPWWWYFPEFFINGVPPVSLLFILAIFVIIIFKWKSPVTWSILPFLAIHCIIGHKEMRFLFPMVYFLPVILIKAIEVIEDKYVSNFSSIRIVNIFLKAVFFINCAVVLVVAVSPADTQISLYKTIYDKYKTPVTLYYISDNPYFRVLDIYYKRELITHYYKRKNLNTRKIESVNDIKPKHGTTSLVVFTNKDNPKGFKEKNKLIYASLPEWVKRFNFNNWLDRSKAYYVYELK